jgi:phosphohistidine phosphatase
MTHELLLLRHGKSNWNVDVDDFNRPLNKRGKVGAKRIGIWLGSQNLLPELVISSPAVRALSTAQKCCKAMQMNKKFIVQDQRLYLAEVDELLEILAETPANQHRIMLVGHNPGLELLLEYLVGESGLVTRDGKILPTATVARIAISGDWRGLKKGRAILLQLQRARDLDY